MTKIFIIEDSVGKKYGKLFVDKFVGYHETPSSRKIPMVECICDCGEIRIASLWDVRKGKTQSCGDKGNHPVYQDRSIPAFNRLYNGAYKNRAIKSGLIFEISEEEFKDLTQQNCHYCGLPPSSLKKTTYKGRENKMPSRYMYNGLDRINSRMGYTLDNVVPCCRICNHAKHTMSYETFVEWLERIKLFRIEQGKF